MLEALSGDNTSTGLLAMDVAHAKYLIKVFFARSSVDRISKKHTMNPL
jgi:hypothetical protein